MSAISDACLLKVGECLRVGMMSVCHAFQRASFRGTRAIGLHSFHSFKKKDVNFLFVQIFLKVAVMSSKDWVGVGLGVVERVPGTRGFGGFELIAWA